MSSGVSTGSTFSAASSAPHCCASTLPSTRHPDTVPGLRSTAVTCHIRHQSPCRYLVSIIGLLKLTYIIEALLVAYDTVLALDKHDGQHVYLLHGT